MATTFVFKSSWHRVFNWYVVTCERYKGRGEVDPQTGREKKPEGGGRVKNWQKETAEKHVAIRSVMYARG